MLPVFEDGNFRILLLGLIKILYVNKNGARLCEINLPYNKIEITDSAKQSYTDRFISWHGKKILNLYSPVFPDYFPAYIDFKIAGNRIYVFAPVKQPTSDKYQDIYVLGLDGKLLKKSSISYNTSMCFDIQNSKYYYLIDNENTETWDLHIEDIK